MVSWYEQIHWNHQHQVSLVYIQHALRYDWRKSHNVVVALVQLLTCLQHLFLAGQSTVNTFLIITPLSVGMFDRRCELRMECAHKQTIQHLKNHMV